MNLKLSTKPFKDIESITLDWFELIKSQEDETSAELENIFDQHKLWLTTNGKEGKQADLTNYNLKNIDLSGKDLSKAILKNADLENAILGDIDLAEADLEGANLKSADLMGANLEKANLKDSTLSGAKLKKANLNRANLRGANLEKANLGEAKLNMAKLSRRYYGVRSNESSDDNDQLQAAILNEAIMIRSELKEASLRGVKFRHADLSDADLKGADLCHADFYKSKLNNADLRGTNLSSVENFEKAVLRDIQLQGASGLKGHEFVRSNVTGAMLPNDIAEFKVLTIIEETSKNARNIFFSMLLGCVYSLLTIATTSNVHLLTNSASSPLPIIGTKIPIAWFYLTAPVILVLLYMYFHFYLQTLWEGMASLPAIFPDGKRLDQRAYPWLLNGHVRRHFKLLKTDQHEKIKLAEDDRKDSPGIPEADEDESILAGIKAWRTENNRPVVMILKEMVSIFLAWWTVPLTLVFFGWRYLCAHDWSGTIWHIALLVVSVTAAFTFLRITRNTLRKDDCRASFNKKHIAGILLCIIFIIIYPYAAIEGIGNKKIPWQVANLEDKEVSIRPPNYWELDTADRSKSVQPANLGNKNLRYAKARGAFMVNANLMGADLRNADFRSVDLKGTKLEGANLSGADLRRAMDLNINGACGDADTKLPDYIDQSELEMCR